MNQEKGQEQPEFHGKNKNAPSHAGESYPQHGRKSKGKAKKGLKNVLKRAKKNKKRVKKLEKRVFKMKLEARCAEEINALHVKLCEAQAEKAAYEKILTQLLSKTVPDVPELPESVIEVEGEVING